MDASKDLNKNPMTDDRYLCRPRCPTCMSNDRREQASGITLNELRNKSHAYAVKAGFWSHDHDAPEPIRIAARLALVHSELSEALEELRKPDFDLYGFAEEIADVFIRLGDILGYFGVDIDHVVRAKADKNETRPWMHNKVM